MECHWLCNPHRHKIELLMGFGRTIRFPRVRTILQRRDNSAESHLINRKGRGEGKKIRWHVLDNVFEQKHFHTATFCCSQATELIL